MLRIIGVITNSNTIVGYRLFDLETLTVADCDCSKVGTFIQQQRVVNVEVKDNSVQLTDGSINDLPFYDSAKLKCIKNKSLIITATNAYAEHCVVDTQGDIFKITSDQLDQWKQTFKFYNNEASNFSLNQARSVVKQRLTSLAQKLTALGAQPEIVRSKFFELFKELITVYSRDALCFESPLIIEDAPGINLFYSLDVRNETACRALFKERKDILFVCLPLGLTEIYSDMFSGCSNMILCIIPSTCKIIDSEAFYWCENLKEIYIPNGVKFEVDSNSHFKRCTNLEKVHLPRGLVEIPTKCFSNCSSLTQINLSIEDTFEM